MHVGLSVAFFKNSRGLSSNLCEGVLITGAKDNLTTILLLTNFSLKPDKGACAHGTGLLLSPL
jgi:hypothetical protein